MSKVLRRKSVSEMTGLSRSTIYEMMRNGKFPVPVRLGPRSVGWLESDIQNWIASRERTSLVVQN